jgi:hypothetical protein
MNMTNLSKTAGILLILLGSVGFAVSDGASWTALIPAFVGIPMFVFGFFGERENLRKHMMHAAAGLSLLGFLGTVGGIVKSLSLLTGGTVERPQAAIVQAVMAIICLGFLILAVKSFIDARRVRKV